MSEHRKLNVGPLPEQSDDYSQYEETDILWGRIIIFGLLALAIIVVLSRWLMSDDQEQIVRSPAIETAEATTRPADSVVTAEPSTVETAASDSGNSVSGNAAKLEIDTPTLATPVAEVTKPAKAETAPLISPVTSLHEGIIRAELSSSLKDGLPVAPLAYHVPMSEEGIIKVILYTHMKGLKGRTLYHDWYRNEQRQARVKIPVRVASQHSHSSKYINRQMQGEWTVKVTDKANELYAEAHFVVAD